MQDLHSQLKELIPEQQVILLVLIALPHPINIKFLYCYSYIKITRRLDSWYFCLLLVFHQYKIMQQVMYFEHFLFNFLEITGGWLSQCLPCAAKVVQQVMYFEPFHFNFWEITGGGWVSVFHVCKGSAPLAEDLAKTIPFFFFFLSL